MQIHTFWLFLTTVLALIITPGPDMIYVAGRSLSQGGKAAVFSALGVAIGYIGHTLLVTLGLASILAASPIAFRTVQLGGAAYLIFLAFTLLRSEGSSLQAEDVRESSTGVLIRQGILTSILNPKGLLFYFALLPQFYVQGHLSAAMQMLVYGLGTSLLCFTVYGLVGLTVSRAGSRFAKSGTLQRILPKFSGCVLLGLGLYLLRPMQR
ncbi:threonine/homoserine/homoserine lactone efflux protein [Geothermobacter ehrlichii]|uniref:Threonine/homoserine/homoserine lactone efflux protein n=1 Tax=Geothermobacter ehrlichii TaxID=213224 RepID=A0A5D3WIX8_9BACT|nr:LysE family translocator [Geothermobacter ehrlichii]TYO95252.1 threonine/homoserine/homoserine lactone efflux protein [Geothermobacter ehrlichii]